MSTIANQDSKQNYSKPNIELLGNALDLIQGPSSVTDRDIEEITTRMPLALSNFVTRLMGWKGTNENEATRDKRLVWFFKFPAILLACAATLLSGFPTLLKISGTIVAACVALDGFIRPGRLYGLHRTAEHDIQNLAIQVCDEWLRGKPKAEDEDALADEIIIRAEKERSRIENYLRDGEAALYR